MLCCREPRLLPGKRCRKRLTWPGDGEDIILSEDLTVLEADAAITIPEGKGLTLDMNGHVLDSSMYCVQSYW